MLAITQPIRIGDLVTLEDDTGVVEDIRLTYTFLRTGSDARLIVPNEKIASSVLRNDSIVTDTVAARGRAVARPRRRREPRDGGHRGGRSRGPRPRSPRSRVEGVKVTVGAPAVRVAERVKCEAELRAKCLQALREAGLR